jgi:hypothetical protein
MPTESTFSAEVIETFRAEYFCFKHREFHSFFRAESWTKALVLRIGNIKIMSVLLELIICILAHYGLKLLSI